MSISPEEIKKLVDYYPDEGVFVWRYRDESYFSKRGKSSETYCRIWNDQYAGKRAFTSVDGRGYSQTRMLNQIVTGHRAAFAFMEGRWPEHIDHINGVRSDNRWCNIREVTNDENCLNRSRQANNKSGHCGVRFAKNVQKWCAYIKKDRKPITLGYFTNKDDAIKARKKAEREMGFHKNHGREGLYNDYHA